jgi:hypothetical protein
VEGGLSAHPQKNPDLFWCRHLGLGLGLVSVGNHIKTKKDPVWFPVIRGVGCCCYFGRCCLVRLIPVSALTGRGLYCLPVRQCNRAVSSSIIFYPLSCCLFSGLGSGLGSGLVSLERQFPRGAWVAVHYPYTFG